MISTSSVIAGCDDQQTNGGVGTANPESILEGSAQEGTESLWSEQENGDARINCRDPDEVIVIGRRGPGFGGFPPGFGFGGGGGGGGSPSPPSPPPSLPPSPATCTTGINSVVYANEHFRAALAIHLGIFGPLSGLGFAAQYPTSSNYIITYRDGSTGRFLVSCPLCATGGLSTNLGCTPSS